MEGPAHVVALGQLAQRPAHVDLDVGGRRPGRARARPSPARRQPMRLTASATTDSQAAPLIAPSAKATLRGAGGIGCVSRSGIAASSSCPMTVTQERPRRVPTTTRGHHQDAVARVVGEAEAAEADQPGAGGAHLVADHGRAGDLLPPVRRVGEPVGARGPAARGHAPGDHALATAQPGHRLVGGQQVEQRLRASSRGRPPRRCEPRDGQEARRRQVGWSRAPSVRGDRSHSVARIRSSGSGPVDDHLVAEPDLVEEPGDTARSRAR